MKSIHPISFVLGLLSGLVVLIILTSGLHLFGSSSSQGSLGTGPSLTRMAQRLGISEADLQKEISGGKTIQQIAQEHGLQFGNRRRSGTGSTFGTGAILQGSGASLSSTSSGVKVFPKATIPAP